VAALISLEENSPLTVQEAMAAGVPVVTSNRCGMPYQVTDGETGYLVNPENPVETADRLQELIANDELRTDMGARARVVARARFHPTAVVRRTRAVYRALAGRAAPEQQSPQSL
jgi:glycosyltransferase involved in cell wall biosynthesis